MCRVGRVAQPVHRRHETARENGRVEAQLRGVCIARLFLRREQIEEQRGEPLLVEDSGDGAVARTEPTAAAAVREQHDAPSVTGNAECSFERHALGTNRDVTRARHTARGYVSGSSPACQVAERSRGSTARVSSKCTTASNCSGRRARKEWV